MVIPESVANGVSYFTLVLCAITVMYAAFKWARHHEQQAAEVREVKRTQYLTGDKLTIYKRLGEDSSAYYKGTIISKDADNPDYYYCEVIYPDRYEEPLEHIHINHIVRNLSAEYRKRKAQEDEKEKAA